jgi:hypothetical protein
MTDDDRREDVRRLEDKEVAARIRELEITQEKTLDVMLGPLDAWGVRQSRKGLVHKVDSIKAQLSNGGVRVRLPVGLWALLITMTSGMAGIAIALINSPPSP